MEDKRKICHNCKGKGTVDGGSRARINKEANAIRKQEDDAIRSIREKDPEKFKAKKKAVREKYAKLIEEKQSEKPARYCKCAFCNGEGLK